MYKVVLEVISGYRANVCSQYTFKMIFSKSEQTKIQADLHPNFFFKVASFLYFTLPAFMGLWSVQRNIK